MWISERFAIRWFNRETEGTLLALWYDQGAQDNGWVRFPFDYPNKRDRYVSMFIHKFKAGKEPSDKPIAGRGHRLFNVIWVWRAIRFARKAGLCTEPRLVLWTRLAVPAEVVSGLVSPRMQAFNLWTKRLTDRCELYCSTQVGQLLARIKPRRAEAHDDNHEDHKTHDGDQNPKEQSPGG